MLVCATFRKPFSSTILGLKEENLMRKSPEFGLAPMEGISELPFRLWMSQTGAPAFMGTPFLRATDTYPKLIPSDFAPEIDRYRDCVSYRLIPQVMASQAEDFVRTARLFPAETAFVDLNAGCPSSNPISSGAGSGLLRERGRLRAFMEVVANSLPAERFSLKMRLGFDDSSSFEEQIEALAPLQLARLTIHGRTRKDRYDGLSRWDLISLAASRLSFPVVASGDIVSQASWEDRVPHSACIDSVIVGRGALRNPWIFRELRGEACPPISLRLLELSLASLGLLLEAHHTKNAKMDELLSSGVFLQSCGFDCAAWEELYARTSHVFRGEVCPLSELRFERAIIGRLKMLWNSFRSSLPEPFFAPTLLRASDFPEWIATFPSLWESDRPLALAHRADLDWLYTSSRKRPGGI